MTYCKMPFETAEIHSDGEVYGCSAGMVLGYSFGNIFEKPFDEIWNSEKAKAFRQQFIDKDYKYCNFEKCSSRKCAEFPSDDKTEQKSKNAMLNCESLDSGGIKAQYPKRVQIQISSDIKKFEEHFDSILSALKGVKLVNINTETEFFEDKNAEKLVKMILKTYPDIKFAVFTNGRNLDERHLKKYGLWNNLAQAVIKPKLPKSAENKSSSAEKDKQADISRILKDIEKPLKFLEKLKKENRVKKYAAVLGKSGEFPKLEEITKKYGAQVINTEEKEKECVKPFVSIEIHTNGNVYACCPSYITKDGCIGNIWENSIEEIWSGKKAQELRKRIRCGDYSLCNLDICLQHCRSIVSMLSDTPPLPKFITLGYDMECNLHCLTCRDKQHLNSEEENKFYNETIFSRIEPMLKNLKYIGISCAGEAFFSKHSRKLIKKIASEYEQIQWTIFTNGVLFNKANCKALGIYGRIYNIQLSLPALDKELYHKILRGSDYDTVMKNLKEISYEYNHKKTIKNVNIRMVVSSLNYKEIPKLAKFAKDNNFFLSIASFNYWGTEFGRDYTSVSVWDKNHPEYENFKKVLKHKNLNYSKIKMPPLFEKIRGN